MAIPIPQEIIDKAALQAVALIESGVPVEKAIAQVAPKDRIGRVKSGGISRIRTIVSSLLLMKQRSAAVAVVQVKATASKEAAISSLIVATTARTEAETRFEEVKAGAESARKGAEAANVEAVQAIEEGRNTLLSVAIVAALAVAVVVVLK